MATLGVHASPHFLVTLSHWGHPQAQQKRFSEAQCPSLSISPLAFPGLSEVTHLGALLSPRSPRDLGQCPYCDPYTQGALGRPQEESWSLCAIFAVKVNTVILWGKDP